nr:hypothetical protein [Maridesulfovibrio ferrireducens]
MSTRHTEAEPWDENREYGSVVDQQSSLAAIQEKGIAMPTAQPPKIRFLS